MEDVAYWCKLVEDDVWVQHLKIAECELSEAPEGIEARGRVRLFLLWQIHRVCTLLRRRVLDARRVEASKPPSESDSKMHQN